jgi:hypothetical protein
MFAVTDLVKVSSQLNLRHCEFSIERVGMCAHQSVRFAVVRFNNVDNIIQEQQNQKYLASLLGQ